MSEFYLTLPSSSNPQEFPDNKANSFKIRLPDPLVLDGQWKVALASISLPEARTPLKEILGEGALMKEAFQVIMTFNSRTKTVTITNTVTADDILHYEWSTGESFMKVLTHNLKNKVTHQDGLWNQYRYGVRTYFTTSSGTPTVNPSVFWWPPERDQCVLQNTGKTIDENNYLLIKKELAEKMGWIISDDGGIPRLGPNLSCELYFTDKLPDMRPGTGQFPDVKIPPSNIGYMFAETETGYYRLSRHANWRFINLNSAYNAMTRGPAKTLYVYSDVCKKSVVGNQQTDFLREVPYFSNGEGNHYFEPALLRHLPVQRNVMETIEVQIASDHSAELAQLGKGTTTLCLHFKKDAD